MDLETLKQTLLEEIREGPKEKNLDAFEEPEGDITDDNPFEEEEEEEEEEKEEKAEYTTSFFKRYGYLPTSIWYIPTKDPKLERVCADKMAHGTLMYSEQRRKYKAMGKETPKGYLSQFHPDVAKRIIEFWNEPNDTILDPFAGRARAMIAKICGRNYTGYEISEKAFNDLVTRAKAQSTLFKLPYKIRAI